MFEFLEGGSKLSARTPKEDSGPAYARKSIRHHWCRLQTPGSQYQLQNPYNLNYHSEGVVIGVNLCRTGGINKKCGSFTYYWSKFIKND